MKVNLNKCKAGDKLVRRDGDLMTYKCKCDDGRHELKYKGGGSAYWTSEGCFSSACDFELDSDIVSIQPAKSVTKSIKFTVDNGGCYFILTANVHGFGVEECYSRRSDAIRGAKRFCKSISHECVIVSEVTP